MSTAGCWPIIRSNCSIGKNTSEKNKLSTAYYDNQNLALAKLDRKISKYTFNKETLGFRLDSKTEIALFRVHAEPQARKIEDFFDYAWGLIDTLLVAQQNAHLHGDDWQRTVYIDTLGVKTMEFDITDAKKKKQLKSGRDGVKDYFAWFDQANAINKI